MVPSPPVAQRRSMPRFAFGALLSVAAAAGCADFGDSPDVSIQTAAIVNGEVSAGDDAVVALVYRGTQFCTGTLVSQRTVVTAAHCLPPNLSVPMTEIKAFFGTRVGGPGGQSIAVVDGLANPDWNKNKISGDIGVIALAADAPAAPATMAFTDLTGLSAIGAQARVVGYGITEADGAGNGIKREGVAMIERIESSSIYLDPGPSATCNGDSGGPLFVTSGGIEYLAGVHSRSDCAANVIAERVDVHALDFVQPFIEANEGAGSCDQDGLCASGCENPDPDCPCAEDGICSAACEMPATDLDCSACAADGVCNEDCQVDDDCALECEGDDCGEDEPQGCSAGGSTPAGAAWLIALIGLAIVRRRRR